MSTENYMVVDEDPLPPPRTYPPTIKEMGWGPYLAALSGRVEEHLIDVVGQQAKKDIRNAARVLKTMSDLEPVTRYLNSITHD